MLRRGCANPAKAKATAENGSARPECRHDSTRNGTAGQELSPSACGRGKCSSSVPGMDAQWRANTQTSGAMSSRYVAEKTPSSRHERRTDGPRATSKTPPAITPKNP